MSIEPVTVSIVEKPFLVFTAQIATVFGLVLFIGLMSLILVMLAVERNTRRNA